MRGGIGRASPGSDRVRAVRQQQRLRLRPPDRPTRPERGHPGTITLAIRRHRAPVGRSAGARSSRSPAGPARRRIPFAEQFARVLGPIAATRDLIVFDQRGIGLSTRCPATASNSPSALNAPPGRRSLNAPPQLGPTRSFYTTADTVADIEAIRAGGRLRKARPVRHLLRHEGRRGVRAGLPEPRRSAGARLGRAPERTRSAQPLNVRGDPSHPAPAVRRARLRPHHPEPHRRSGASSCADESSRRSCAAVGSTAAVSAHTIAISSDGSARDPARGRSGTDPAHRIPGGGPRGRGWRHGRAGAAARAGRTGRSERSGKPERELRQRRCTTRRAAKRSSSRGTAPPTRADAPGRSEGPDPRARRASAIAPFAQPTCSNSATCRHAPSGRSPRPRRRRKTRPFPSVPTLILSGADDLRTPTANAREVAAQIPGSHLLVVPNIGHSVLGDDPNQLRERCPPGAVRRQADQALRGHTTATDPGARRRSRRSVWRTSRRRGATTGCPDARSQAVVLTLADFDRQLALRARRAARVGRPRRLAVAATPAACAQAGRDSPRADADVLHGYSYVPGVTVSGRAHLRDRSSSASAARRPRTARCVLGTPQDARRSAGKRSVSRRLRP